MACDGGDVAGCGESVVEDCVAQPHSTNNDSAPIRNEAFTRGAHPRDIAEAYRKSADASLHCLRGRSTKNGADGRAVLGDSVSQASGRLALRSLEHADDQHHDRAADTAP